MALKEELKEQGDWLFKHRSFLPIIIIIIGTISLLYTRSFDPSSFPSHPYSITCLIISLIGLAIRAHVIGYSADKTSGRNTKEGQVADELNTTGLYSLTRNPLYLGNFLIWIGITLFISDIELVAVVVLLFWLYYERIIFAEEQFLKKKFTSLYTVWALRTPVFLPKFKNYIHPELRFDVQKVIEQEKNGLLAIFLLFTLLDNINYLLNSNYEIKEYLVVGCIISIFLYAFIKIYYRLGKLSSKVWLIMQ